MIFGEALRGARSSGPSQHVHELGVEVRAMVSLRRGITVCREAAVAVTRLLLESTLNSEEEHVDCLGTQLSLMDTLGEQLYLLQQVGSSSARAQPGGTRP